MGPPRIVESHRYLLNFLIWSENIETKLLKKSKRLNVAILSEKCIIKKRKI